jgi:hypothetical protein
LLDHEPVLSIAHEETVLAERSADQTSAVRVIVRGSHSPIPSSCAPTPSAVLDRRLAIASAIVRAHRRGAPPERLRRLDAAYLATRMPLAEGESYDE